ncbi:Arc35p [Ascoidea rubescens DSM 1968]|uniref:Arp2/3 complex 34 kDa subunit n=1 Tax=Ascoidea rubescens DSM 1968 TaxID=1344418 RepID=A0A1D2VPQ8_9ASCO|nr:P34-Arc-domain-containing protein [Ascoidea rubescens DSM 1968]ODV63537.1 P34-Arc-domain-containing protein [Ascoidea rubescens DSM 1968]
MLQLQSFNLSVEKTLSELINNESPKSFDRIISDFDNTLFHISTPESKTQILLSIYLKCFDDLVRYGDINSYLANIYSNYNILDTPEPGYNFSIYLDLVQFKQNFSIDQQYEFISKISFLKRNCLAAPFEKAINKYNELSLDFTKRQASLQEKHSIFKDITQSQRDDADSAEILVINYRNDESIYIKPSFDRVTVIFSTIFKDETDKIFGKVFLQEFVDARRRSVQNSPQVLYSHIEPPLELRSLPEFLDLKSSISSSNKYEKGFVTFVLFPRHLTSQKRDNTISQIQLFRTYFHYHIKCSKAFMHSRMRSRVLEYLKLLNRAKPDFEEGSKKVERKTASGRRFEIRN